MRHASLTTKVWVVAIGIVTILLVACIFLRDGREPVSETGHFTFPQEAKSVTLMFGDTKVVAEVAQTRDERVRGLSGRESLKEGEGMLFVFPVSDRYAFWMPDMRFSIDIVWLDETLKIVDIKERATPESYPEKFAPRYPARYVLEVPAGFMQRNAIEIGMTASLRE